MFAPLQRKPGRAPDRPLVTFWARPVGRRGDRPSAARAGKDARDGASPMLGHSPRVGAAGTTAATARRTIDLFAVSLPGSSRDVDADVVRADAIYRQCGVAVRLVGGQSLKTDLLDRLDPKGVLNEYASPTSPTIEETEMLAHRPGPAGALRVFYVPAMSAGSRGEAFLPSLTPALPPAVVVSDSAAPDTLAHELGHVLMNEPGHHADPDNLLAAGAIRNVGVDKLEPGQCAKL